SWTEAEPERGQFELSSIEKALENTFNPVLIIDSVPPAWATNNISAFYASLIRKIGSVYDGDERLIGVEISTIHSSAEELDAYKIAFEKTKLLINLENQVAISYLKNQSVSFGLIVKCSSENRIECCELFARQNLQFVWKKNPVLIQSEDEQSDSVVYQEALRWHAAFSNCALDLGFNFSLRRLTYPKAISNMGAFPLRFWFVNTGTSPCYQKTYLRLLLSQGDSNYEISLNAATETWGLGDITHNEMVKLPSMKLGCYKVAVGLFFENNEPVRIDISNDSNHGFYEVGTVEVDAEQRDDLFHIWDDYYPEGYYPLEDPQAPNESN
ncbi:MAG: hypothetical protein K0Q85_1519, partial [Caproiciproducens sp.]|nr:hypothetical protein [Caproiciproducens sp.]